MRVTLNRLHDRVNQMVRVILFENDLKRLHDTKAINARQYAIVSQVRDAGRALSLAEMRRAPWYLGLYAQRTDKTKGSDLGRLRERGLLKLDKSNRLWPGFVDLGPEKTE